MRVRKRKGDKYGLESDTTVYNGPFVLTDWKHEQGWKLKKMINIGIKDCKIR